MMVTRNSTHIEDIDSTNGEAITGRAAVAWDISIISDAGGTGVVTFHDGNAQTDTKVFEVRVKANEFEHASFPRGKRFENGIFVKSNVSGLDLAIDYD